MKGRSLERVVALPLLLGAGVSAVYSSTRLTLGSSESFGPGMWPFLISLALGVGSLGMLLEARGGGAGGDVDARTQGGDDVVRSDDVVADDPSPPWQLVVVGLVALLVFAFALDLLGFLVAVGAVLVFWLRFLGREGWPTSVIISVVATVALHLVFVRLLGVPLG